MFTSEFQIELNPIRFRINFWYCWFETISSPNKNYLVTLYDCLFWF